MFSIQVGTKPQDVFLLCLQLPMYVTLLLWWHMTVKYLSCVYNNHFWTCKCVCKSSAIYESWTTNGKYVFYSTSKLGEISLILSSVKDFDTWLLKKYTVKVLHSMHARSLGSTKFSNIWILDHLRKHSPTSSFTLKSGRIPSWYLLPYWE